MSLHFWVNTQYTTSQLQQVRMTAMTEREMDTAPKTAKDQVGCQKAEKIKWLHLTMPIHLGREINNYMQAHLVGRNISRLRVSPLVSFPILLPHFLSKREMTLRGDFQFNKQNAERERWQISRPRCIAVFSA